MSFGLIRQTVERSNRRSDPEKPGLPTRKKDPRRITETEPKMEQGGDSVRWIKSLHDIWNQVGKYQREEISAEEALDHIGDLVVLALEGGR